MSKPYLRYDFTRQSLFDLVWRMPASKIQKQFNIRSQDLKETCKRFQIPQPSSMYWTNLSIGKKPQRAVLPRQGKLNGEKIRLRVRNPNYSSATEDQNRMRAYVRVKAERKRDADRGAYLKDLIDRVARVQRLEYLISSLTSSMAKEGLEKLDSMLAWANLWIDQERKKISPETLNGDLRGSGLFDSNEVQFDFDADTFESSLLTDDEHEHLVTCWLDQFEDEEEIIDMG